MRLLYGKTTLDDMPGDETFATFFDEEHFNNNKGELENILVTSMQEAISNTIASINLSNLSRSSLHYLDVALMPFDGNNYDDKTLSKISALLMNIMNLKDGNYLRSEKEGPMDVVYSRRDKVEEEARKQLEDIITTFYPLDLD